MHVSAGGSHSFVVTNEGKFLLIYSTNDNVLYVLICYIFIIIYAPPRRHERGSKHSQKCSVQRLRIVNYYLLYSKIFQNTKPGLKILSARALYSEFTTLYNEFAALFGDFTALYNRLLYVVKLLLYIID